jgi:hypothetical protein
MAWPTPGRRAAAAIAVVAVAAGAVVAYAVWPRGGTAVTVEDAVTEFRARTAPTPSTTAPARPATSVAADRTTDADPAPAAGGDTGSGSSAAVASAAPPTTATSAPERDRPAPGVYVHAASGYEQVQFGMMPPERRSYPAEVPVTVVHDDDPSCFVVTVDFLEEHSEDTTYCRTGSGGLRLAAHHKRQSVGAMRPTAVMSCDPDVLHEPGLDRGELRCELTVSNGPARQHAVLVGTSRVLESTTVEVGDHTVEATRIDLHYDVSGDMSGTWDETLWLSRRDRLPLQIHRDLDLRGFATFRESSSLAVKGPEPIR